MKKMAEKYISKEYAFSYSIGQAELIDILRSSCKKDGFTEHDGFRIKVHGNRFRLRNATGHYPGYPGQRAYYGKVAFKEAGCLIRGRFEPCPRSVCIPMDILFTVFALRFGFLCQDLISWIWVIMLVVFLYSPYGKQNGESEKTVLELLSTIK